MSADETARYEALAAEHDRALELVADARHEINNALMAIMGLVELLEMRPDLDFPIRKRLQGISAETTRILNQVKKLESLKRR